MKNKHKNFSIASDPESKKISIPIGGLFIATFIIAKILYSIYPDNGIVDAVGQTIKTYLPVLEKRYDYSYREFGVLSANWQVTFVASMILVCVVSFCYSLLIKFSRSELLMMHTRYAPAQTRSIIALIIISTVTLMLFVIAVFFPWMPKLISEPSLYGPLYRVVPAGVSWSNGWDVLLFYTASQTGVFIRGLIVIMKPPPHMPEGA